MQEMMGLIGLFIIHPRRAHAPRVDREFGLILQEWALLPNNTIPNSLAMEFNWLTINGKAGPATTPLIVKLGERVRIRVVNLGIDHHPMHMHWPAVLRDRHGRRPDHNDGGHPSEHGWSGGTMGMMTIIRIVRPELFDRVQELKAEQARKAAAR